MKLFTFLLAGSLAATPAFALAEKIEEQLRTQLTPEQLAKANVIHAQHRPELEALREEVRRKSQMLLARVRTPGRGEQYQKDLAQVAETVQLSWQAFYARQFQMRMEIRELLTRDQIAAFEWIDVPPALKTGDTMF